MNIVAYEEQVDGVFWSMIVTLLVIAGITIIWIWNKIGQKNK